MQAAFILGMFGALFFVITAMTTTMVESTQQLILRQEAQTRELFADVERNINDVLLKTHYSIVGGMEDALSEGLTAFFGAGSIGTKWTNEQLAADPWGMPYNVSYVSRAYGDGEPPIGAFGVGQHATPTVHYFTISSPGRDRHYQTRLTPGAKTDTPPQPSNYEDWVALRAQGAQGDDIVHTFSTRDALTSTWNRVQDVNERMAAQLRSDYVKAIDTFLKDAAVEDRFEDFYGCVARGLTNCSGGGVTFSAAALNGCIRANTEGTVNWPASSNTHYCIRQSANGNEWIAVADGDTLENTYCPQMTTANCWMAEPSFQGMGNFPSMVAQARNTADMQCASRCMPRANDLGMNVLQSRDPLYGVGSLEFEYDGRTPSVVVLKRRVTTSGWEVNMDIVIDGERAEN